MPRRELHGQAERETAEKAAAEAAAEAERLQKKLAEAVAELEDATLRNAAEQQRAQVTHPPILRKNYKLSVANA